ncbi:enolase C-terminal domain-like protein [Chelatococcus asaccharovorans]|uniref:enolase C-terminal domain-like protein n=1 Tax=Chelatococcus asaccharovorans TaxID=28210 RepID=UPI00224C6391|nr:enolase C-terminal domain-like protein [Chelatococcus asaccharovorans]CAH1667816.1 Glucarate dehydratase [Chelatococcus asaccharovorans]CAH1680629.1 Glucarate dehydratase [Chelatococcus asaccharovorans]
MKIIDMKVRCVAIPLNAQLRHNTGVHPGYLMRTVLELITDEGIVGLGEVGGGDQRGALMKLKPRIIGMDPFHLEVIKLKTLRAIYYLSNARLYAAIEMACLDIQGKALGRPLCDLLGGPVRDRIAMIAYLFWRYDRPGGGHDEHPEDMADLCQELHETLGVTAMKLKAGVLAPEVEVRAVELCRDRMGPEFGLRIDPNGVWSVPTAIRIGQRLEAVGLEYLEDPSWGLEGNAAVRKAVRIPIATNMYPAKFDDLGPAIRLGAVDIVLTDIHYWEGPRGVKDLAAVCRTFGLGVAMHSGAEFGIELAAMLHTAATIPEMSFAGDAHYHYLTDDIIEGGLMRYEGGAIRVPTGPGLGVTLDEDKMRHYAAFYEEKGDYYARFHQDPYRPDWYPVVGGL